MAFKYRDSVTLIQKQTDGSLSRVNAIVLTSRIQPVGADKLSPAEFQRRGALRGGGSKPLPAGEYLDVVFPVDLPEARIAKESNMNEIFRRASVVPEYKDGAAIGWEAGSTTAVAPVEPPPAPPVEAQREKDSSKGWPGNGKKK